MQTRWSADGEDRAVTAPVSLVVSAFAPVVDVRKGLTPELAREAGTALVFVDLGAGRQRLGGSCLAQTQGLFGGDSADVDDPALLKAFFAAQRELRAADLALAYHDRSDGGLVVSLLEMAFASRAGLDITVRPLDPGLAHRQLAFADSRNIPRGPCHALTLEPRAPAADVRAVHARIRPAGI